MPVPRKFRKKVVISAVLFGVIGVVLILITPRAPAPLFLALRAKAMSEAKQVGIAAKIYASEHEGRLPESFGQLVPDILDDDRLFQQMQLLAPGAKLDELPPRTVIATGHFLSPRHKRAVRILVHADMSVEAESAAASVVK